MVAVRGRILLVVGVLMLLGLTPSTSVAEGFSHDGFRPISWTLYPNEPAPNAASKYVVVAVHERNCAGGRNPILYLQRPEVEYLKKRVIITLWIEKIEGVATCPSNPVGRLKVKLQRPLGSRKLFDGSSSPPRRVMPGEDPDRLPGYSERLRQ